MILTGPDAEKPIELTRLQMDQIETFAHAINVSVDVAFALVVYNMKFQLIREGLWPTPNKRDGKDSGR